MDTTNHRDGSVTYLEGLKHCPHCQAVKPMDQFGYRKMDPDQEIRRPQSYCKPCRSPKPDAAAELLKKIRALIS